MPYELTNPADLLTVQDSLDLGAAKSIVASTAHMRRLRSLVGRVVGGEARARIGLVGDSQTLGRGSGTGANGETGARAKSPVAVAARLLQAAGIAARSDFVGSRANVSGAGVAGYTTYNPNLAFVGSTWTHQTGGLGLPGGYWTVPSGTDAMTFTPEKAADRLDTYYLGSSGTYGTFTVSDAGGTLATENAGDEAALGVYRLTVSRAVASMAPFVIQRSAGGAIGIFALDPWNSTLPEICLCNLGCTGATSAEFINQSFAVSARHVLAALGLDYMIAELGLNDRSSAVAKETFLANLQTLRTNHSATSGAGGFALATSMPATAGGSNDLSAWLPDMRTLALTLDMPLIDHAAAGISREAMPGDYYDAVHLLARGSAMKGRLLAEFLTG